jgi:hypothetical protein
MLDNRATGNSPAHVQADKDEDDKYDKFVGADLGSEPAIPSQGVSSFI